MPGRGASEGGGGGGGRATLCRAGAGACTNAGSGGGRGIGAASQSWFAVSFGERMPHPLPLSGLGADRSVVRVSSAIENEATRAPRAPLRVLHDRCRLVSSGAVRRSAGDQTGGPAAGGGCGADAVGAKDTVGAARSESAAAKNANGLNPMMRP